MPKTMVAAQLYTVRQFTQTAEDMAETLKKVKKIGYDAVQLSGHGPIDPQTIKDMISREGLEVCATHISFERMQNDMDNVIAEHKLWGCKYVGVGSMPGSYQNDGEGFVRFAKEASKAARILADHGLKFIYHNHHFEFQKFDGKTGMDILFEESDPEAFDFEIDTFWVQAGGADPMAWIRKVRNRMAVIHFKDMVMNSERKQVFAEVGEGNLNWPAIIEACRDIQVRWHVVEQDVCERDPFESLAISLKNLKTLGLE